MTLKIEGDPERRAQRNGTRTVDITNIIDSKTRPPGRDRDSSGNGEPKRTTENELGIDSPLESEPSRGGRRWKADPESSPREPIDLGTSANRNRQLRWSHARVRADHPK